MDEALHRADNVVLKNKYGKKYISEDSTPVDFSYRTTVFQVMQIDANAKDD